MTDYQIEAKVKNLAKEHDTSIRQVCQKIGMTENGLALAFRKNSIKVETLQKISDVFDIPITYFFIEPEGMNNINQIEGNSNLTVQGKKNKTDSQSAAGKKSEAESVLARHELTKIRQQLELAQQRVEALEKEIELKDEIINLLKQQR